MRNAVMACAVCLLLSFGGHAGAMSLRDIASVTADYYFDGSWWVETGDVLLARLWPALSVEARYVRDDSAGWSQNTFYLGPVINFTPTLYMEAVYGLGFLSTGSIAHEAEVNLSAETDITLASLGVRGTWFPSTGYFYVLPSMGFSFHPVKPLALLGKLFMSADSLGALTESFWGEAAYAFGSHVSARAGFTVSYAGGFGYSAIVGVTVTFNPHVSLKYAFSYFSNVVQFLEQPLTRNGVENLLSVDFR